MTRSIITAAVAVFAAGAAVFVAFDDASARGNRGGYQRAALHRAAMPRMNRAAMPRMNRAAMPRMNRVSRSAPRINRAAASQRSLRQTSRLSSSRMNQLGRRAGQSALSRTNNGRFNPRLSRTNTPRINRAADLRRNPLASRPMNDRRPNQSANGRSLPRADLAKFDRNRNSAAAKQPSTGLANRQAASNNQVARRYENKNMNGSSTPSTPKGQDTQKQPQGQNTPKQPKDDRGTRQPNPGQQILINWGNDFVRGVGGGLSPTQAGTAFSVCQNLAWCAAGAPPGLGAWLAAPAPGWGSNIFGGFVDSFTPTDPNDPLSTPFDNGVRNAVKGAQHYDMNPFNNDSWPKTGPAAIPNQ